MVFTILGFTCEVLYVIRLAMTRDDVVFLNKLPACEILETRQGPHYPPPVRKMLVINQKYENNQAAIAAFRMTEAEELIAGGKEEKTEEQPEGGEPAAEGAEE